MIQPNELPDVAVLESVVMNLDEMRRQNRVTSLDATYLTLASSLLNRFRQFILENGGGRNDGY